MKMIFQKCISKCFHYIGAICHVLLKKVMVVGLFFKYIFTIYPSIINVKILSFYKWLNIHKDFVYYFV